jgi:hypothetical protein
LQLCDTVPNIIAMNFKQSLPLRFRGSATLAQLGITQHLTDRHARRFQAI